MSFDLRDFVQAARNSKQNFLNHINNVRDDQWDWKPYPECKSIRETLAHLVSDYEASLEFLKTGEMPDFEQIEEHETDIAKLIARINESHDTLCSFILERFANTPLDTEVNFFGGKAKLGVVLAELGSEDNYHAGQVAFIRMATDPEWNYYKEIYGF